jgi:hypothetical protein
MKKNLKYNKILHVALEVCLPLKPVTEAEQMQVSLEEGNGHVMTMDERIQEESNHYRSGEINLY